MWTKLLFVRDAVSNELPACSPSELVLSRLFPAIRGLLLQRALLVRGHLVRSLGAGGQEHGTISPSNNDSGSGQRYGKSRHRESLERTL